MEVENGFRSELSDFDYSAALFIPHFITCIRLKLLLLRVKDDVDKAFGVVVVFIKTSAQLLHSIVRANLVQ